MGSVHPFSPLDASEEVAYLLVARNDASLGSLSKLFGKLRLVHPSSGGEKLTPPNLDTTRQQVDKLEGQSLFLFSLHCFSADPGVSSLRSFGPFSSGPS